jgi:hypothetical protein
MNHRFTGDEWATRRLLARDPTFRACWEDYQEALEAAERFRGSEGQPDRRARDYVALLRDLEEEIQERLDAEERGHGRAEERGNGREDAK